jgi:hypothetical protein
LWLRTIGRGHLTKTFLVVEEDADESVLQSLERACVVVLKAE